MECMFLLCTAANDSRCSPCKPLSESHQKSWDRYIDLLLFNWEDKSHPPTYYQELKKRPYCCRPEKGYSCRLNLIHEPRKEPKQFYDLACVEDTFFTPLGCQKETDMRCCVEEHCNIPTQEELKVLMKETPPNVYSITTYVLLALCIVLFIITGSLYFKLRKKNGRPQPVIVTQHGITSDNNKWSSDSLESHNLKDDVPLSETTVVNSIYQGNKLKSNPSSVILSPLPGLYGSRGVGSLSHFGSSGIGGTVFTPSNVNSNSPANIQNFTSSGGCSNTPTTGTNPDLLSETCSGSGSGKPLLVQRTIARQVQLEERIGEGRYGVVWRGVWQADQVAAKIFASRDECSWFRETEIYQTVMLRHANILGFIAADNKDTGLATQLWLITDYHPLGSLYEFLHNHILLPASLVRMVASIVNGLAHLHMEITGTQGKPAIAHRDLKSRNILVKMDGECCIADLGFALKLDSNLSSAVDLNRYSDRVGTRRYMAPEVLDNTIRLTSPEAFKQADMYSLGLVFWEVTRRCLVYNLFGPDEYQLPYQDIVSADPCIEEMKSVVCEQGLRPALPAIWSQHEVIRTLQDIMSECWYASPSARLSAMRVKKSLAVVQRQIGNNPSLSECPPTSVLLAESGEGLPTGLFRWPPQHCKNVNLYKDEQKLIGNPQLNPSQQSDANLKQLITKTPNSVTTASSSTTTTTLTSNCKPYSVTPGSNQLSTVNWLDDASECDKLLLPVRSNDTIILPEPVVTNSQDC